MKSFQENGLSHDLVRMQFQQYEQKRTMILNQIYKYINADANNNTNKKGNKQQTRFEASLL